MKKKSRKSSRRHGGGRPAAETPDTLSRGRRWLFRLLAVGVFPLVCVGLLELGLRLVGFGYPTRFFLPTRIQGRAMYVQNDKYGRRFFPPQMARSPAAVVMPVVKPPHTYRLFILGGSAALGDPRPAFSFGRYLGRLLDDRFPGTHFEVICTAMTAINSNVVLPIARECAHYDGDFWLIYMGNNEMVGPFGANTVFGPQAPPLLMIRTRVALESTRVGQLLGDLGRWLRGHDRMQNDWEGMKMFVHSELPPHDPRKEAVYHNFRHNLEDILAAGERAHVQIILSTVASNLRDCAPFASMDSTNLSAADRRTWAKLFRLGAVAVEQGHYADGRALLGAAAKVNPTYAETHYLLGLCDLELTNVPAAHTDFQLALDDDALPFRTDSHLNKIITEVAREHAQDGVHYLDAVKTIAAGSPDHIPGCDAFWEHVHFNFDGNYRLARAFADTLLPLLPPAVTHHAAPAWASEEVCNRQLGLTIWNRASVLETVLQRLVQPPFTNLFNDGTLNRFYWKKLESVRKQMTVSAAQHARALYVQQLKRASNDFCLHENFAEFLEATGHPGQAAAQWQQVETLLPQSYIARYQRGRLLSVQGKYPAAQAELHAALALRPDLADADLELGRIEAKLGRPKKALAWYDRAHDLRPDDARFYLYRANALADLKQRPEALHCLREAVRLSPNYAEARYLLGVELAMDSKYAEAEQQFAAVVRLRPNYVLAHLNLGVALAKQMEFDRALRQFEETLRLDPKNQRAQRFVQMIHELQARPPVPLAPH